ncbi:YigZ family protein [Pelistega europaea]|uniref:YigZ family protein n=1 Tax=Pelistega europaea TaxID=106147 RepID=A0A7Y4L9X9_9BURK|nr:YigZ family protein [Pelistega europaea]
MFRLVAPVSFEETIKKSLFIAHAAPVASAEEALVFFQQHHQSDATHNCWAFKLEQSYRFNDDGEPGGTAGRPILQAIEGKELVNTAVLVIRYYGGIKLGTGGLVRAYGGTAAKCLDLGVKEKIIPKTQIICSALFSEMAMIKSRLLQDGIGLIAEDFNEQGVVWTLSIPKERVGELEQLYVNLTRGKGSWVMLEA